MKQLIIVACILSSCVTTKLPDSRLFTITAISGDQFTAVSGRLQASFTRLPGDSVWIGKTITVARAKFLK